MNLSSETLLRAATALESRIETNTSELKIPILRTPEVERELREDLQKDKDAVKEIREALGEK